MSNLLLTICARGGSKGVKGKNIKFLNGKPLIFYTIKQALEWGGASNVIVSTDSIEIAQIAKDCGAEVPFLRPAELAIDTAPTLPVLRHALRTCESFFKKRFGILMDLAVTAPVRKVSDLDNAFQLFKKKKPKSLISVVPAHRNPYFNIVEESADGKIFCSKPNSGFHRRQDAPPVYDLNASIYIYKREFLLREDTLNCISDHSIAYVMDEISSYDIDTELDFKLLEFLIKESVVQL